MSTIIDKLLNRDGAVKPSPEDLRQIDPRPGEVGELRDQRAQGRDPRTPAAASAAQAPAPPKPTTMTSASRSQTSPFALVRTSGGSAG